MGLMEAPLGSKIYDWAWGRPNLDQVKMAGGIGVVRYIYQNYLTDADLLDKPISVEEANRIYNAGLGLLLVYETYVLRAAEGIGAGFQDAEWSIDVARRLGYTGPLFVAVDYDAEWSAVAPYANAYRDMVRAAGYAAGIYGGIRIINPAVFDYYWQASAWSYGEVSPKTHLHQLIGTDIPQTDINNVLKPTPMFHPTGAPSTPTPDDEDDDMYVCLQAPDSTLFLVRGGNKIKLTEVKKMWNIGGSVDDILTQLYNAGMLRSHFWNPIGWDGLAAIPWDLEATDK